jgi:hypothetical protein
MDRSVENEGRDIHRAIAHHDLTVMVHQEKVADPHPVERHGEGIHPEVVGKFRIARCDVAGDSFSKSQATKDSQPPRQALFAMQALFLH